MTDWTKLTENLTARGYAVKRFPTKEEAAAYLDGVLDGKTIGIGGSLTVEQMGLYDLLRTHNTVHWHWGTNSDPQAREKAAAAQVYLTSVNGLAETGELINIDGTGNRVASTMYGHEAVYFLVGVNKIAPTQEEALWRARNIASPKNAQRLKKKTPCAVKGDRCYDCNSPDRICNIFATFTRKPKGIAHAEVVLVEEELGY